MANQTSSTAPNKSKMKGVLGLMKQFKSPKVSVSASSARDPVPGNDATRLEEEAPIAGPISTNSQVLDWKVTTTKESLNVAMRFVQTLLKRVPECIDNNPVKMAFSIAKVIIEIKDAVGDNKDELAQRLEDTANMLLAVERMVVMGVPKAAEEAKERLRLVLAEKMKELKGLADKSLGIQILDHEAYRTKIQQIFQRVKEATMSFLVEMAMSIQQTASEIRDDTKKAALKSLCPSEKADHKTVLEEQGLKREVCTDGTRVKILEDITKWANDHSSASPRVFWLTGQAGSGKTTILYTIAKRFEPVVPEQRTVLGANFFCSRQFQETQVQTRILPTIAYQLARKCKSYADALHVADKFDAVNHEVAAQMKDLLVGPWQQSEPTRDPRVPHYLITIDALDEIMDNKGPAFLCDLLTVIDEYDLRGFKFLVTSRPNPKVVALCKSFPSEAICRLQDVPIEETRSDIKKYLDVKLPKLAGSPQLAELEQQAGGLFIYAATAVRYLTPSDSISAAEQIELLDNLLSKFHEPGSADDATFLIDKLYQGIMHDTFSMFKGMLLTRRLRILYTFLCTAERTSTSTVAALVADGHNDVAKAVLDGLHSVLYIQDDRVFWYHASFPDFIFDQARSNFRHDKRDFAFSCNESEHHGLLGESCFRVMESGLRFNMGNITSSFLFDRDNASLSEQVDTNISAVLRYSSHHWDHHLPSLQVNNTDILRGHISDFFRIRVLFWIEAMNLLKSSNRCTPMLQSAREWVLKCENRDLELAVEIGEAANFATYFTGSPAAESTPHLYISALATWPWDTSLSRNWKNQFTGIPVITYKGRIDLPLMTVSTGSGVLSVAFSSDGMRIVSGSSDGSVRVWDASTGVKLKKLRAHTDDVFSVAFSSDGMRIVSGSLDKSVRVWDVSTGVELKELKGCTDFVYSVAFSNDGTQIVSGSRDGSVRVWDASTGVELKEFKGHTNAVMSVAFSCNGMRIVSGSFDRSVRVWDMLTGVELKELKGHTNFIWSVAFSNDGTRIVSGSSDGSLRVWDASTGAELKQLKGHTSSVHSVAFSNDGTRIVSGSSDESVRVWDASTGAELKQLKGHTDSVWSVTFSNDGTRIVSGSPDKSVRVWDALTGVELKELEGHTGTVWSVAFSNDGTQIVSGSNDRSVRVWDALTGVKVKEFKGHTSSVFSVAFSNDGTRIMSGSHDKSVRVWDASTGGELKALKGHTNAVYSAAFSNDGRRIVSGSSDGSLRVWNASTGVELKQLKDHTGAVLSVAFSSDEIVFGSYDTSLRVWDASTGAELKQLKGHTDSVKSVAFSNDGTRIVSGSSDKSVRVWDASTGAELKQLKGHTDSVKSVAFSNDGTRIVSGSSDKSVRVWDASTGVELKELKGHTDSVWSVAFSNDGMRIVSGSSDKSVRVWDASMIGHEHLTWRLADTSWIVSSQGQNHLMWVPPGAGVTSSLNILTISRSVAATVDFDQSVIGVDWVRCYTP